MKNVSLEKYENLKIPAILIRKATTDELVLLANNKDVEIRAAVAKNPNTPIDTLIELSKDISGTVRVRVANNYNTPPTILNELSKDTYIGVRIKVASNLHTPLTTIQQLLEKHLAEKNLLQNSSIPQAIAGNIITPMRILEKIIETQDSWTQIMTIQNPNFIIDHNLQTIAELMFNSENIIRREFVEKIKIQEKLQGVNISLNHTISHEFIEKTPVGKIFEKHNTYNDLITAIQLLLSASEEYCYYDIKSFHKAYNAVTEENMIPYIAAGIFATPIEN